MRRLFQLGPSLRLMPVSNMVGSHETASFFVDEVAAAGSSAPVDAGASFDGEATTVEAAPSPDTAENDGESLQEEPHFPPCPRLSDLPPPEPSLKLGLCVV